MMHKKYLLAGLLPGLMACTENSALGNDREAHLFPPEPAAEQATPESLTGIAPGLLKPSSMSAADLASIAGSEGLCRFRYTDDGFPVLLYSVTGGGTAVVKLNGKLITLPGTSEFQYAAGPVRVIIQHPEGLPIQEQEEAVMVVRLADAPDELGFAGAAECP